VLNSQSFAQPAGVPSSELTIETLLSQVPGRDGQPVVAIMGSPSKAKVEPPVEIILTEQMNTNAGVPSPDQIQRNGTLAKITRAVLLPDGTAKITVFGVRNIAILDIECEAETFAATIDASD